MANLASFPTFTSESNGLTFGYGESDSGKAPLSALHAVAAAVRDVQDRANLQQVSHNNAWTEYLNAVDSAKEYVASVLSRSPEKVTTTNISDNRRDEEEKVEYNESELDGYVNFKPIISVDVSKIALAASVIAARTLRVSDPDTSALLSNVARSTLSSAAQKSQSTPIFIQPYTSNNSISPLIPLTTPTKSAAIALERARVLSETESIATFRSGNVTPPGSNKTKSVFETGTVDESVASSGSRKSGKSGSSIVKAKSSSATSPFYKSSLSQSSSALFSSSLSALSIDMTSFEDLWCPSAESLSELANDRARLEQDLARKNQESQAVENEKLALMREAEAIATERETAATIRREMAEAKASGRAALRLQAAARGFLTRKRTQLPYLLAIARAELERDRQTRAEEEAKQLRETERRAAAEAERIERVRVLAQEAEAMEIERLKKIALERSEAKERERRRIELLEAARVTAELEFQERLAQEAREAHERQLRFEFEESQKRHQALELSRMAHEEAKSLAANKAWRIQRKEEYERSLMGIEFIYAKRMQSTWSMEADIKRAENELREIEKRAKAKAEQTRIEREKRLRYLDSFFGDNKTMPILLKRLGGLSPSKQDGQSIGDQRHLIRVSAPSIAARLQALWRGKKVRENPLGVVRVYKQYLKNISATRIQALWRGVRLRKAISEALEGARYADGDDFEYTSVDVDSFLGPLPQHLLDPEGNSKNTSTRSLKSGGNQMHPLNANINLMMNLPPRGIPMFVPPQMNGFQMFGSSPVHMQMQMQMPMPMIKGMTLPPQSFPSMPPFGGLMPTFPIPPGFPLQGGYQPGLVAAAHEEQQKKTIQTSTRSHVNTSPMQPISENLLTSIIDTTSEHWATRKIGVMSASPISTPSRVEKVSPSTASRDGSVAWELESIGSESRSASRGSLPFSTRVVIGSKSQQQSIRNNGGHTAVNTIGPSKAEIEAVEGSWGLHDPAIAALILKRKSRMAHASSISNAGKAQSAVLERAVRVASTDGFVDRGTFMSSNGTNSSGKGSGGSSSFVSRVRGAVGGAVSTLTSSTQLSKKYQFGSVQDNLPDDLK